MVVEQCLVGFRLCASRTRINHAAVLICAHISPFNHALPNVMAVLIRTHQNILQYHLCRSISRESIMLTWCEVIVSVRQAFVST